MSRLRKLMYVAGGLLVVAIAVNCLYYQSLLRMLRGQSKLQAELALNFKKPKPIAPVGAKEAKVKIQLMAMSANPCHQGTIKTLREIALAVPARIRAEFAEPGFKGGKQQMMAQATSGCMAALTINGRGEFDVVQGGRKMHIVFHGPLGMGTPPDWVRLVVESELARQYPKGLKPQERKALATIWRDLPKRLARGHKDSGASMSKASMPGAKAPPP